MGWDILSWVCLFRIVVPNGGFCPECGLLYRDLMWLGFNDEMQKVENVQKEIKTEQE